MGECCPLVARAFPFWWLRETETITRVEELGRDQEAWRSLKGCRWEKAAPWVVGLWRGEGPPPSLMGLRLPFTLELRA